MATWALENEGMNPRMLSHYFTYSLPGDEPDSERVYIHLNRPRAAEAFGTFLTYLKSLDGFSSVKVVGPTMPDGTDTAVVYFQTQEAANAFVESLKEDQARHPEDYGESTPYFTDERLPGVGVGTHPPDW